MGVSLHVVGIKPPDAAWKKMKAVYDACVVAGIVEFKVFLVLMCGLAGTSGAIFVLWLAGSLR